MRVISDTMVIGITIISGIALIFGMAIAGARAADRRTEASVSDCRLIQDLDQRQICIALARNESALCYGIQQADLRAECRADVALKRQ